MSSCLTCPPHPFSHPQEFVTSLGLKRGQTYLHTLTRYEIAYFIYKMGTSIKLSTTWSRKLWYHVKNQFSKKLKRLTEDLWKWIQPRKIIEKNWVNCLGGFHSAVWIWIQRIYASYIYNNKKKENILYVIIGDGRDLEKRSITEAMPLWIYKLSYNHFRMTYFFFSFCIYIQFKIVNYCIVSPLNLSISHFFQGGAASTNNWSGLAAIVT